MKKLALDSAQKRFLTILLVLPLILLFLGLYNGLMQVLYRSGIITETSFLGITYYQGLTLHGVINAVVLTTFFTVAFSYVLVYYFLKKKPNMTASWVSAGLMIIGTLLAAYAMLTNQASVLYTFYPPLRAHPTFYLGAALLIVGSWVAFWSWIATFLKWRKENKGAGFPFPVMGVLINFTIWQVCTLSVAYEVLVMLLPWSLGLVETINVPLARTLFWFFGHPLVYFWLLPAYTMYYVFLPKLAGGKLYSENAGRFVFLLFLILSIPVGAHHQFTDPTITRGVKLLHAILTYGVALPSLLTAFTVAASLEYSDFIKRKRNSFSLMWLFRLPYFNSDNYLFAYLIAGLGVFVLGGISGIVNASYSLNNVVHNTAWVPGHFHMTIGGPVFLAILGMSLYLIEQVSGKKIRFRKIAMWVPYIWLIGLFIFSRGLMVSGLLGAPRRTNLGISYLNPNSDLYKPEWVFWENLGMVGGVVMFIGGLMFFWVLIDFLFIKKSGEAGIELPVSEVYHKEKRIWLFNNMTPWLIVMFLLILISYIPALYDVLQNTGLGAPPFSPDSPVPIEVK